MIVGDTVQIGHHPQARLWQHNLVQALLSCSKNFWNRIRVSFPDASWSHQQALGPPYGSWSNMPISHLVPERILKRPCMESICSSGVVTQGRNWGTGIQTLLFSPLWSSARVSHWTNPVRSQRASFTSMSQASKAQSKVEKMERRSRGAKRRYSLPKAKILISFLGSVLHSIWTVPVIQTSRGSDLNRGRKQSYRTLSSSLRRELELEGEVCTLPSDET